jgi:hypothetical protein
MRRSTSLHSTERFWRWSRPFADFVVVGRIDLGLNAVVSDWEIKGQKHNIMIKFAY